MSRIIETTGPMNPEDKDNIPFDAPAPKLKPGEACLTIHTRKMVGIGFWCWIGEWEILDNVKH